jgi:hypothetical protein
MERKDFNNTVQTNSSEKKQVPENFTPLADVGGGKRKTCEGMDSKLKKFIPDIALPDVSEDSGKSTEATNGTNDSVYTDDTMDTVETGKAINAMETNPAEAKEPTVSTMPKRISSKQRKESLEEYRETFLQVPTLEDRKPVFISREVRDQLDEIVRRLDGRRMSLSGFIENLARHHLEMYHDDVEVWKRL